MTANKSDCPSRGVGIAVRLWAIMMVLVLLTVGCMWLFQVVLMERNYTQSNLVEAQSQLEPVMEELQTEDLGYNEQLIAYLSSTASEKMMIVDSGGHLVDMYTYGHPIDLAEDRTDL